MWKDKRFVYCENAIRPPMKNLNGSYAGSSGRVGLLSAGLVQFDSRKDTNPKGVERDMGPSFQMRAIRIVFFLLTLLNVGCMKLGI